MNEEKIEVKPNLEPNLEPVMRKTVYGTPVKLLVEIPAFPAAQGFVQCLAYPATVKEYTVLVRCDDLVPPYTPSQGRELKTFDYTFIYRKGLTPEERAAKDAEEAASTDPEVIKARQERMSHARKHRIPNPETIGIPDKITCSKCGTQKVVAKPNVVKYAKRENISIEEWIKQYQCPECLPRKKGRQTNSKYALLPKELRCHAEGCGKVLPMHPSMIIKQAEKSGKGFNEFTDNWLCRLHRPKKESYFSKAARVARGEVSKPTVTKPVVQVGQTGQTGQTKHRGRVADPKWNGMTGVLKCTYQGCAYEQKQHPSLTLKAAELHGETFAQFVANWKCKLHRKM